MKQFSYDKHHYTSDNIHTIIEGENDNNYEWIYIGEVKEGTDHIPHGIGIKVLSNGDIEEGYWQNGGLQGRGRDINLSGVYYIGEYKEGERNGEGTRYFSTGNKWYEGGWKDGQHYGQGTCYEPNGDKYTGQWDGQYKGQGEINYKDGTKYTGQWDRDYRGDDYDSKRHGVGTLYTIDGQVLNQGKWEYNEYKGKQ